jgi:hypothetical protein
MTDNPSGVRAMTVQLICPNLRCRKILSVPEALRGRTVRCQHCQTVLRVPHAGENTLATTAAPATNRK